MSVQVYVALKFVSAYYYTFITRIVSLNLPRFSSICHIQHIY